MSSKAALAVALPPPVHANAGDGRDRAPGVAVVSVSAPSSSPSPLASLVTQAVATPAAPAPSSVVLRLFPDCVLRFDCIVSSAPPAASAGSTASKLHVPAHLIHTQQRQGASAIATRQAQQQQQQQQQQQPQHQRNQHQQATARKRPIASWRRLFACCWRSADDVRSAPPALAPSIKLANTTPTPAHPHVLKTAQYASMGNGQPYLLPLLNPADYGKKCLVLDLDETLVHSSFKAVPNPDFIIPIEIDGQVHNVYVLKRPGVDTFMHRLGSQYEIVVFTASLSKYADPVLDMLDVHRVVKHRLFREACLHHKGNYVKDLNMIGRDLKDIIILDNSPVSYIFHPSNAIPISSWFNDPNDTELLDLIPFLEDLKSVDDVTAVLTQDY
ncbi:hypothetical protein HDU82_002369 [Entophlyctis luteolus]|nr:hypothetical protein HDU82_002369 [Entophlyctis luteolus]